MFRLWAVVRHTLAQCLRMKIALAFIVLLGGALLVIPLTMREEATLANRLRVFLQYSASATALLLALVTLLLSVAVVTSDIRGKQIFTVVTKPLARWQYLLGRWAGVVLLSGILLAVATGIIYAVMQHLRGQKELSANDRRVVETEIFTARNQVGPRPTDVTEAVQKRLTDLKNQGNYQDAVNSFLALAGGNENAARAMVENQVREEMVQQSQSCGYGESLRWEFHGIQSAGREIAGQGRVDQTDPAQGLCRIQVGPQLLGQLLRDTPVQIDGVATRVLAVREGALDVQFDVQDRSRQAVTDLARGKEVAVVVEPAIQINYKLRPVTSVVDDVLSGFWIIDNPSTHYRYVFPRELVGDVADTLTVPARAVDNGRLTVTYVNRGSPADANARPTVLVPDANIAVLFRAGDFGPNLLRWAGLVLLMVMFLAALGMVMASFLSFPVATLMCMVLLVFSMAGKFFAEATKIRDEPGLKSDAATYFGHYVLVVMKKVLPDYAQLVPCDMLVDGMQIPARAFLDSPGVWTVALTAAVLAVACLIFQRRELARVQV